MAAVAIGLVVTGVWGLIELTLAGHIGLGLVVLLLTVASARAAAESSRDDFQAARSPTE